MPEFSTDIFTRFDKQWGLLCAGTMANHNAMSISWGGMGTLWNKPVVTVNGETAKSSDSKIDTDHEIGRAHV